MGVAVGLVHGGGGSAADAGEGAALREVATNQSTQMRG